MRVQKIFLSLSFCVLVGWLCSCGKQVVNRSTACSHIERRPLDSFRIKNGKDSDNAKVEEFLQFYPVRALESNELTDKVRKTANTSDHVYRFQNYALFIAYRQSIPNNSLILIDGYGVIGENLGGVAVIYKKSKQDYYSIWWEGKFGPTRIFPNRNIIVENMNINDDIMKALAEKFLQNQMA